MLKVIKRNGDVVPFSLEKIISAVERGFLATNKPQTVEILEKIALRASAKLKKPLVAIEEIQDAVEATLMELGYETVAKAYILYRQQRARLRDWNSTMLNFTQTMEAYLDRSDWRVKENSTVNYSLGGLILHSSGTLTANYWLKEIYDPEIAAAHRNGDFHIHDLSMLSGYCAGWSLEQLIKEGLGGVEGRITSAPSRHLSTLTNQMVNFLGIMQNEWAGAQAFSSFDTYLAPFVKTDNLGFKETKQAIQSFIYGVNTPSRWGTQAPFTNVTMDWVVPERLRNVAAIVGGELQNFTYGACQKEMDIVNRAFIEIMLEGDAKGRGFQYPIPTYNITKDFDWENENVPILFEMTAKYGTPYFQNFVNSDLNPDDVRSMCCRLQLDKRELRRRGGGLFGSDEFTGSIGVVTLNLPRIAFTSINEEEFFKKLDRLMELASRSLEIKRKVIIQLYEEGLYPYTRRYLTNLDNHFSTIGLVGLNEACLNAKWIAEPLYGESGRYFGLRVLDHMRKRIADFQEETDNLYNLEATPAESTAFRLARIDKKLYPAIFTAGEGAPYYTKSSHLPVNYTEDIFSALEFQEAFQTKYTGGTVFHTFLGEKVSDWETCRDLVKKIALNFRIPYFTISPTYSVCSNHGYLTGEVFKCPYCGSETEVYSRITGYYRPIKNWNDGKQEEFKERRTYLPQMEAGPRQKEVSSDSLYLSL